MSFLYIGFGNPFGLSPCHRLAQDPLHFFNRVGLEVGSLVRGT